MFMLITDLVELFGNHIAAFGFGAFGNDDNGETTAAVNPGVQAFHYAVNIVRNFGNKAYFRAAGYGCVQGDPAGVPAHHFQNKYTVMAFRRGYQLIHSVGGYFDRGLEAKGKIRAAQIVINGLGYTDDI